MLKKDPRKYSERSAFLGPFLLCMFSVNQAKKIDPNISSLPDDEILTLIREFGQLADIAFCDWMEKRSDSKNLKRLLRDKKRIANL